MTLINVIHFFNFDTVDTINSHLILKHLIKTNCWKNLFLINKYWYQIFKFMFLQEDILKGLHLIPYQYWMDGDKAVKLQYMELIFRNPNLLYTSKAFIQCGINGNQQILEFLVNYVNPIIPVQTFDSAVKYKHHNMIYYLHETNQKCTSKSFEYACENGDLFLARWLYINRSEKGTQRSWELAAKNGHINILYFLYTETKIWLNDLPLSKACEFGKLTCAQFLNFIRDGNYNTALVNIAIKNKHHDIVYWLLLNRPEGLSEQGMIHAINNKDEHMLEIIFMFGYGHYIDMCIDYCQNDQYLYNYFIHKKNLLYNPFYS
jgi:hypothetical protein